MSKNYALTAQKREKAGKGIARTLRREDRVPAVIYGDNKAPELISLAGNPVRVEFAKGQMSTHLCDLTVDGQKILVLARDIQIHPVTDQVEHIDFLRVGPKTKIHVSIPVHFVNEDVCPGIKEKGVLNVVRHDVDLVCNAVDIPEFLAVDLKELKVGQSIKITDVQLPKGAASNMKGRDLTIATIVAPTDYVENEITAPISDEQAAAAAGDKKPDAKKPAAKK